MRHGTSDSLSPLVAATLQKGFPLLRFPAPLEALYQASVAGRRLRVLAMGFAFCFPLYMLLFVADYQMLPDSMAWAVQLRVWVFLPAVVLSGLVLFRLKSQQAREWMFAGLGLLSCLLDALVSFRSHSSLNVQHLATLNAIVIYTVLVGRFWPMLVMCSIVSCIYVACVWHMGRLFSDFGVGVGLLLQANITNMLYGCYLLEKASRHSFLVDHQEADMDAELQQTTDRLARIAQEDALTGLANRRRFTEGLHQAHEQTLRDHGSMALLMIDIDCFKPYNDRYGHPAGDECLRQVAQALAGSARPSQDLVARWGGEEFAVILPGADTAQALGIAERMLEAVRARAIVHEASQAAAFVTLSMGVAVWRPQEGDDVGQLVATADDALYEAKTTGRNRAVLRDLSVVEQRLVSER
jgi:diguanylate cyclase (GGDEF)-like protein